jgi:hypothetical protein
MSHKQHTGLDLTCIPFYSHASLSTNMLLGIGKLAENTIAKIRGET